MGNTDSDCFRFVLSAAHCFCRKCRYLPKEDRIVIIPRLPKQIKIRIGSINRYVSRGDTYRAQEIIIHPKYRPTCKQCSYEVNMCNK